MLVSLVEPMIFMVPRPNPDVNSLSSSAGCDRSRQHSMKPTMPKYCRTEREDKLLVVTLDRPDVLNSLNAPACFELEEIFNGFERDPTLWIAVITGAGDRAFCAGHDLADAPDAPMPPSGWA